MFDAAPKSLRPHQERSIAHLRQSLSNGARRPILALPTGAGKTVVAANIIRMALEKGNRVTFCVPAISLVDQTVSAFWQEGISEVGVIQGDHHLQDWSKPVQVASIQTIDRRCFPESDLVIVDECHQQFKAVYRWMDTVPDLRFVGLSATPWARGLGKHWDDLIIGSTIRELIDAGYLSDFIAYAAPHPDLSGVKTTAGDYNKGQLGEVMNNSRLVGDVVDTWLRLGEGRPTLAFAVDRAHAKALQKQFEAHGVGAGYVDAHTPREERAAVERRLNAGEIRVVCNVGCLTTGVDWDVRCVILARPTKSEMLFVQMVGRGLRTAEGKQDCIILDHGDNHARLGFVTDIHHTRLNNGNKPETATVAKEALPKECGKCGFMKPPKVHECPSCGFKPERQSQAEFEEGELVAIMPEVAAEAILNAGITALNFLGKLAQSSPEAGERLALPKSSLHQSTERLSSAFSSLAAGGWVADVELSRGMVEVTATDRLAALAPIIARIPEYKSRYAKALHIALSQKISVRPRGAIDLSIDGFREVLGVPPGKLTTFGNLNAVAIKPALAEIVESGGASLSVEPRKVGREVTSVRVSWGGKRQPTLFEKQDFYSGLLTIQAQRGRAKGWVSHTYKDKFGVWPRGLSEEPCEPSAAVLGFVKHKDIAFAKRRAANGA